MNIFKSLRFALYYGLVGGFIGLLVLFFMPESKMSFNWQSVQAVWKFYHDSARSPLSVMETEQTAHSYADAVDIASPSVVSINTFRPKGIRPSQDLESGERILDVDVGLGSGVILSSQGYIVTNYHVIRGAEKISVNFPDGRKRYASLVGDDEMTDIAVLKADTAGLQPALLGQSSEVRTGDVVLAIGNPLSLGQTVTLGIVSDINHGPFNPHIKTDATINYGNSGGALINAKGEVIGINSRKLNSKAAGQVGINIAIPIDTVSRIVDDLILHHRVMRNWFGVNLGALTRQGHLDLDPGVEYGSGVIVTAPPEPGSPAEIAQIQQFDYIVQFDEQALTSLVAFYHIFTNTPIGKTVKVKLIRQGELIEVDVALREHPLNKT